MKREERTHHSHNGLCPWLTILTVTIVSHGHAHKCRSNNTSKTFYREDSDFLELQRMLLTKNVKRLSKNVYLFTAVLFSNRGKGKSNLGQISLYTF